MSRDMTSGMSDEIVKDLVRPAILVEADFDSGAINGFTGYGTLTWDGKTYQGSGDLLSMDLAEETATTEAQGSTFTLAGINEGDIALYEEEEVQGRAIRVLLALFDADNVLIADPVRIYSGKMDVPTISVDPENPTISLTSENDMIIVNRSKARHRTHEDQQNDYPGDKFYEFVAAMQNKEIIWK